MSLRPLDLSSDAECILSCLVAFGDVPNEFPNVFVSGSVTLDPWCGSSREPWTLGAVRPDAVPTPRIGV